MNLGYPCEHDQRFLKEFTYAYYNDGTQTFKSRILGSLNPSDFAKKTDIDKLIVGSKVSTLNFYQTDNVSAKHLVFNGTNKFNRLIYAYNPNIESLEFNGPAYHSFDDACFLYCSNLKTIKINGYTGWVGPQTFLGCYRLKYVDMTAKTLTSPNFFQISNINCFDSVTEVPDRKFIFSNQETLDYYAKQTNWNQFKSQFILASDLLD